MGNIYKRFARVFHEGPYTSFSRRIAKNFTKFLENFHIRGKKVLDVACGEGTFAVEIAKQGFKVVGVDLSSEMLKFARERAKEESVPVIFLKRDMRELDFHEEFDIVTCWFDSLNYLLDYKDLKKTFERVHEALKTGGTFLFDMNTVYGLLMANHQGPVYIQQDGKDIFEVQTIEFDLEESIATFYVTVFERKEEGLWERFDEIHRERGYRVKEIASALSETGFVFSFYEDLLSKSPLTSYSRRLWCAARKVSAG
ncbi:class I SAM-dependent methyltransferase [Thermotoga sp. 38H-to]|uniref:class I SAM-dependent methyltransferase n=1 Tax=Thermotoga sp. 38H-to TaxID=1755812 RepID=UPI0013EB6B60|nr:class I SAM-dependent methyltransferase [Thermotoga sp. 38H-to]KAF2959095.1 SAM-dependent methyltransferase [Thermotoga sp. 38H-to]